MTFTPNIETVDEDDDYYRVKFNDADTIVEIPTPDWAEDIARSVSEDSEVRTGHIEGSGNCIYSVLIPKTTGRENAKKQAQQIVEKIDSEASSI